MRRIKGIGSGRARLFAVLVLTTIAAAGALGLSPVFGGRRPSSGRISSTFEAGVHNQRPGRTGGNRDVRADQIREARCANNAYQADQLLLLRQAHPHAGPRTSGLARGAVREGRLSAGAPPPLPPQFRGGVQRSQGGRRAAADGIGAWTGRISTPGLPINSILLPTGKVLWLTPTPRRTPGTRRAPGRTPRP